MCILRNDWTRKKQSTQRAYTAQCHIQLSCRKHPPAQVKVQLVERHSLTLMHRDGPCKSERILRESALQFLLHLPGLLVVLITVRLPRAVGHHVGRSIIRRHQYLVLAQFRHRSDGPVRPTLLLVVAGKHHLSTHLQFQGQIDREPLLLELTLHRSLIGILLAVNLCQPLLVDAVSRLVERGQRDYHPVLLRRLTDPLVQVHQVLRRGLI